jgi:hypothetical protein
MSRLKAVDPSPTTWSAVLPIRTRGWRPCSGKGTVTPLVHGAAAQVQIKYRDLGALARAVEQARARSGDCRSGGGR